MSSTAERVSALVAPAARPVATDCPTCGFGLWIQLADLSATRIGLYDDARFPGRLIVSLTAHFDHLEDVPDDLSATFMSDIKTAAKLLRSVTGAARVNVAILGNQEPHVHAHLIPRRPGSEPRPERSPWDDPRPRRPLPANEREHVRSLLIRAFADRR